jgi:uncharacterized protein
MRGISIIVSWVPRATAVAAALVVGVTDAALAPPAPNSPVTDLAGVLSPAIERSLNHRLAAYEASSGHQIVVWIAHDSDGAPIEDFAARAFEAWKIGRAGLDDGLAVFALTTDHTLRIEVGYALEAKVTDLGAANVIRTTMVPLIERGEWDAAIVHGVEAIVDIIEDRPGALPGPGAGEATPASFSVAQKIGAAIVTAIFLIVLIRNPRRALGLLFLFGRFGGLGGGDRGGFRGRGGRSGGGGATGRW